MSVFFIILLLILCFAWSLLPAYLAYIALKDEDDNARFAAALIVLFTGWLGLAALYLAFYLINKSKRS